MKNAILVTVISACLCLSCSKDDVGFCEEQSTCNLQLYPNPISSELTVELLSNVRDSLAIRIYNIYGKEIIGQSYVLARGRNVYKIDLHDLTAGIYYANLKSEENSLTVKLIKQ